MERLTNKREADAQRKEYERRLANGYPRNIPEERFLRLAAYEDSGCEPEEVLPKDKADEIALKLMRLAGLESLCSYDHLRELAEADKEGRVIVLPAKKGDTLYAVTRFGVEKRVVKEIAAPFFYNTYESSDRAALTTAIRNFGKTVFLTREEAEKALQEMEASK